MEREERKKRGSGLLIALILLLLLAVGVLLWLLLRPQPEPTKIPTGNVDVFDIRISCLCKGEDGEDCDEDETGTPGEDGYKNYAGSKINGRTDTTIEDDGMVYVDDINGWYIYQNKLHIFENAAFEYTNKIAPGVSNSYDFKVHNETKKAIKYTVNFDESSEYAVNMRYRLKRGGSYVVGSDSTWVSASELVSAMKYLPSDGVDNYTLDWEWPYEGGVDAADSEAGEKMVSEYSLGIKITFEEA